VLAALYSRQPKSPTYLAWAAVLLLLTAGAVATLTLRTAITEPRRHIAQVLNIGWNHYATCTLHERYPDQPATREQMLGALGNSYRHVLPVVEKHLPGYAIRAAHTCTVDGRRFAHLVARKESTTVSIAMLPREAGAVPLPANQIHASSRRITAFQTHTHVVYIAGNPPLEQLRQIAARLRQDMTGLL
jgi:hypothetical protein